MGSLKLNAGNLFKFITYVSPFLLLTTFIIIGFLNNNPLQSIIYVGSVCVFSFAVGLLQSQFDSKSITGRNEMCDLWDIPIIGNGFNSPSLSTFFITFSAIYVLLPMILNKSYNYFFLTFFAILLLSDIFSKLSNKCTTVTGVVLGFILGGIISFIYTIMLYYSAPQLLFIGAPSNKVSCGKTSGANQKFKCNVYKNGQLVTGMTTTSPPSK